MRSIIVEFYVAKRDCPEGDWRPTVHRNKDGHIWCVSVCPQPFGENLTGLPFGQFDNAMPGTWIAPPDHNIIGPGVVAEKEERGEVVTIRLVRTG